MKKLIPTLLFSLLFVSAYAQNQEIDENPYGFLQNELFIEGNIQYSSIDNQTAESKESFLGINTKIGYFIFDDLAVGLQGTYSMKNLTTKPETGGTREVETTALAPGIFARYYFLQLGKRFNTYGELGGNYGKTKSFTEEDGKRNNEITTKTIDADLSLGINYFVNDSIIISFTLADILSYSSRELDIENSKPTNTINANINILDNFFQTAKFGVMFILK